MAGDKFCGNRHQMELCRLLLLHQYARVHRESTHQIQTSQSIQAALLSLQVPANCLRCQGPAHPRSQHVRAPWQPPQTPHSRDCWIAALLGPSSGQQNFGCTQRHCRPPIICYSHHWTSWPSPPQLCCYLLFWTASFIDPVTWFCVWTLVPVSSTRLTPEVMPVLTSTSQRTIPFHALTVPFSP